MRYLALFFGKFSAKILTLLGKKGGSFPGKYSNKICDNLIKYFTFPSKVILITGTNGKSSTTKAIKEVFEKAGYKTVSNDNGDNIINGLTTVAIKNSDFHFNIVADVVVLEVDELTLAKNLKYIKATDILITNIFPDQLDRVGEMNDLIDKISKSLSGYKGKLYINVDDINSNKLAKSIHNADIIRYSVGENIYTDMDICKNTICPVCDGKVIYDYVNYSDIGKYRCEDCGFSSENPDYFAEDIDYDKMTFKCDGYKYCLSINAIYQVYNSMSVISISRENNISQDIINSIISRPTQNSARMEEIDIDGRKILLNLIKNTAGANEIVGYISRDKSPKSILFLLNNKRADGEDISWIWDVDFEKIDNIDTVVTTGIMTYEAGLRFEYMNKNIKILPEKNLKISIEKLLESKGNLYMISTYTGIEQIKNTIVDIMKG